MSVLDDAVSKIRDIINYGPPGLGLLQERAAFDQTCAAMDAIGDTEWALAEHANLGTTLGTSPSSGILYLAHFGWLDALVIQQEAVDAICIQLGAPELGRKAVEGTKEIRDVRNDVIHQIDRRPAKGVRLHIGIVRQSLHINTFEIYSFTETDESHRITINCGRLAALQNEVLGGVLVELVMNLEKRLEAHKAKFRNQPLSAIFRGTSYALAKLYEVGSGDREGGDAIGAASVTALEKQLAQLRSALEERGDLRKEGAEGISHALAVLARFNFHLSRGFPEPIDAMGIALLAQREIDRLMSYAADVDRTYSEGTDSPATVAPKSAAPLALPAPSLDPGQE